MKTFRIWTPTQQRLVRASSLDLVRQYAYEVMGIREGMSCSITELDY